MYLLIVKGMRRATVAVHKCDTYSEVRELLAVYHALGYSDDALQVVDRHEAAA